MPAIHLNKTHPGLFKADCAIALTHLGVGGLILYAFLNNPHPRNPILAWVFIFAFFLVASVMAYGLFRPSYHLVQWGLILGLALISFLSGAFVLSVGATLTDAQTQRLSWIVPPWPLWAFMHVLCLQEPPATVVPGAGDKE
jgi:hypothetical protein